MAVAMHLLIFVLATAILIDLSGVAVSSPLAQSPDSEPKTDPTTKGKADAPETTTLSSGMGAGIVAGLIFSVIFIIGLLLIAGFMFFGHKRDFQRDMYCAQVSTHEPHPTLQRLLTTKGALELEPLKRATAKIDALQKDKKSMEPTPEMLRYLSMIPDKTKEAVDVKQGLLVKVPGCRTPNILIRKDTQILIAEKQLERDSLHMNSMIDFFGKTLLLCQAPLLKQFVDQWMAIWQERVGVVVWIGAFEDKGQAKIDPYIPLENEGKVTYGPFAIEVGKKILTIQNNCATYMVTVKRKQETREVKFIHYTKWPEETMPEVMQKLENLADFVEHVHTQHKRQSCLENPLPAILAHCSSGVLRTPAFFSAYIGNQMWLQSRKVNVLGIFQFVRRHRWKAFGTGYPFLQVRLVYRILEIIAIRYPDAGVCAMPVLGARRKKTASKAQRKKPGGKK